MLIQIQHLLKLNAKINTLLIQRSCYSNTTLVKVKSNSEYLTHMTMGNSNTTLVKVKCRT